MRQDLVRRVLGQYFPHLELLVTRIAGGLRLRIDETSFVVVLLDKVEGKGLGGEAR